VTCSVARQRPCEQKRPRGQCSCSVHSLPHPARKTQRFDAGSQRSSRRQWPSEAQGEQTESTQANPGSQSRLVSQRGTSTPPPPLGGSEPQPSGSAAMAPRTAKKPSTDSRAFMVGS